MCFFSCQAALPGLGSRSFREINMALVPSAEHSNLSSQLTLRMGLAHPSTAGHWGSGKSLWVERLVTCWAVQSWGGPSPRVFSHLSWARAVSATVSLPGSFGHRCWGAPGSPRLWPAFGVRCLEGRSWSGWPSLTCPPGVEGKPSVFPFLLDMPLPREEQQGWVGR